MANPKCWNYDEKDSKDKANCVNCHHWKGEKCEDEAILLAKVILKPH